MLYQRKSILAGHSSCITGGMDCFFGTHELPESSSMGKNAVVTFSIPDIGIWFKAPFEGVDQNHCGLASLLALLEFIDSNQKYFSNHTYQIFGNHNKVINQVNGREDIPKQFETLMLKAKGYRDKYRFSLEWIPTSDNDSLNQLLD